MSERFGPALGNARLTQGGQQGWATNSETRLTTDPVSRWAISVQGRRGYWKAVVAIAAKNARMCWAMLQRGEDFKMPA